MTHFTVEVDYIVDIARQLWRLENAHAKAISLLQESFIPALTESQCVSILTGYNTLQEKDGEITLVDEEAEPDSEWSVLSVIKKHEQQVEELKANNKDLFDFFQGDVEMIASEHGPILVPANRLMLNPRPFGARMLLKEGTKLDDILWITTDIRTEGRRRRAEAHGRGIQAVRDTDDPYTELQAMAKQTAKNMGIEEENAEEFAQVLTGKPREETPRPSNDIDHRHGWITPDAKFYKCRYGEHQSILNLLGEADHFGDEAAGRGWIKVQNGKSLIPLEELTQKQLDLLCDYQMKHGINQLSDEPEE